jgi:transcription factor C subunit 3
METSGRERRHRYYTVVAYRRLIDQEQLDLSASGVAEVDLTKVGELAAFDANLFYKDESALVKYQDAHKVEVVSQGNKKKTVLRKNPVLPDGTVKLGRPRKHPPKDTNSDIGLSKAGKKRKVDQMEASSTSEPSAKKRQTGEDKDISQLEPKSERKPD